MTDLTSC